jgi:glycosyltransferase involved in cell wall biosynthesis
VGRASSAARVLYVTQLDPSHKFGSLEECIATLAAQSRARGGLLVPVFCGPVPAGLRDRLAASNAPFEPSLDLQTWRWDLAKRLLDLVDRYAIGVVDFSFYAPLSPYVTLLRAMRPRLRLVYTDHRSRLPGVARSTRMRHILRRIALNQYRTILAISDFTYRALSKDGFPRLARCHLFINPARFRADSTAREQVRAELGAGRSFVALVVANLIPWKGVDVALRAMAAASQSAKLWIVGSGPELEKLRVLANELGLGSRVCFVGEQRDASLYLKGADCLICPSLWQEAMGFVNLEAMASSLPVIASRIGGIPEFVANETTGLLVDPGSVQQTAMALRRLIDSPDLCRKLGRSGVTRVRVRYSEEACLGLYLKNYDIIAGISDGRLDCHHLKDGRDRHVTGASDA